MRSLDLSGELVKICGLLKSTLLFGFVFVNGYTLPS